MWIFEGSTGTVLDSVQISRRILCGKMLSLSVIYAEPFTDCQLNLKDLHGGKAEFGYPFSRECDRI